MNQEQNGIEYSKKLIFALSQLTSVHYRPQHAYLSMGRAQAIQPISEFGLIQ
jgi:hypothetical protein